MDFGELFMVAAAAVVVLASGFVLVTIVSLLPQEYRGTRDSDDDDFSSFWYGIVVSLILILAIWCAGYVITDIIVGNGS